MQRASGDRGGAWGYLLPLSGELPPIQLREEETEVGTCTAEGGAVRVDAAALGVAASAQPRDLFRVLRAGGVGGAGEPVLRSGCALLRVDGRAVGNGCDAPLKHGSRVVVGLADATYVFVDGVSADSFQAPAKVRDEYVVGPRLGEGAFGQVYLLVDRQTLRRRRALKKVEVSNAAQRLCADREAGILLSVRHPCVIETYDVTELAREQFLVMEYMAGGDLSLFVNSRRPLTEAQTKLLFYQLALAVQYLHANNVCHRDLKPANILLQSRQPFTLIKVTDFGLSKIDDPHSALRTVAGTEAYLAPEVINDDAAPYTLLVDVWSMGAILLYSLTGALPFPNGTKEAVRQRYRVAYPAERWRGVSVQARGLAQRMLRPAPADRPSVDQLLGDAWLQDAAMLEDARRLTGLEPPGPPRPRRPPPSPSPPPPPLPPRPRASPSAPVQTDRQAAIDDLLRHLPSLDTPPSGRGAALTRPR